MTFDSGLPLSLFVGAAAGYLLVKVLQYVFIARVYLTCAARVSEVVPADPKEISPPEREVLESVDCELSRAGFRPLMVVKTDPLLTFYEPPEFDRVFVSEREPIRALVTRRLVPEMGFVTAVQLETPLTSGRILITQDSMQSAALSTTSNREVESLVGADVVNLTQRHVERLRATTESVDTAGLEPAGVLRSLNDFLGEVRSQMLQTGYTARTADPSLDRFTLKGAFGLAHRSLTAAGRAKRRKAPIIRTPDALGTLLRLRMLADLNYQRRTALHPVRPPGSSSALWVMMAATAALSFVGMSWMWSPETALVILAVIAFHEAGHAVAMRAAGYRDVNIFFVPFVGGLTLGRDSGATVRQRLLVMLAGPVPGLWLAVLVFVLQAHVEGLPNLRPLAIALFAINALNLLPITPLDGGRALELLTSPSSILRVAIQGVSGLALLSLGAYFEDPLLVILGLGWLILLRRQIAVWRLRRQVDAILTAQPNGTDVAAAAFAALATPAYATWRFASRLSAARLFIQQSAQIAPMAADRVLAFSLYAFAWLPAVVALLIWSGHLTV